MQQQTRCTCAQQLACDIKRNHGERKSFGEIKTQRYGGIEMRTGNIAQCRDHRECGETKTEGDAAMRYRSGGVIDDNGTGAREDDPKGAEHFGK